MTSSIPTIPPSERHVGTVILLHGMGDTGASMQQQAERWGWRERFPHIKFVFPTAPERAITLAGGGAMTAWYDILTTNDVRGGVYDVSGLEEVREWLEGLVVAEMAEGIEAADVLLGGFSQGGAVSLYTGVTSTCGIGGVFAVSAYLPMTPELRAKGTGSAGGKLTAVLVANGTNDPVVKHPWAQWSVETLKHLGFRVQFESYKRMGHGFHAQSVADLTRWISGQIPYDISYEVQLLPSTRMIAGAGVGDSQMLACVGHG